MRTSPMRTSPLRSLALAATITLATGCASGRYFDTGPALRGPAGPPAVAGPDEVRDLPMFAGHDGRAIGWDDLMDAVAWADVVFLGEQHDDEIAHALQREVVAAAFARWQPCALSLEMLERDEQLLVSDYFEGIIDADQFKRLTNSASWGRDGAWERTYQTIIDAARTNGGRVVAANAPRRYVRLARLHGYERLAALPSPRRDFFDYPARLPEGGYRERFWTVMQTPDRPEASDEGKDDAAPDEEPHVMTDEEVDAIFHSQLVWDATMAASVARAWRLGAKKVVHLIGQFHTDFDGGTVLELRKRAPEARVLVVSMQRAMPAALLDEDRGRADVVIYTGERPPEPPAAEPGEDPGDDPGDDPGEDPGEDPAGEDPGESGEKSDGPDIEADIDDPGDGSPEAPTSRPAGSGR